MQMNLKGIVEMSHWYNRSLPFVCFQSSLESSNPFWSFPIGITVHLLQN